MKIVLAGGTGLMGRMLAAHFGRLGAEVVILTRSPGQESSGLVRQIGWDAAHPGPWQDELEGADAVIGLAGRSVNCRYHAENRRVIKESRVDSTTALAHAIASCRQPPRVWLQSSTATIYAHRYDAPNDEATGILDPATPDQPDTWRFSIDVARSWEAAIEAAGPLPETRTVLLRTSIVMSPANGSAFDIMLKLVRLGLGGQVGNGRQYISWIHDLDLVRAIEFLITNENLRGPVNLVSPNPLPNAQFMRELRRAWGMPIGLPAFEWMVEIGAALMRTESELVLKSRRVIPGRLMEHGFQFQFPHWADAARDLCRRWKEGKTLPV